MMATQTSEFVTDAFKQAAESFNQAMRTNIQFQEQAAKYWSDTAGKSFEQFRDQADKISKETVPAAKKSLEQFHNTFDQQVKNCLDTLRETFEAGRDWDVQNVFDQTTKLWQNSFEAMRSNVDAMAQTNIEMFEKLCELSKKACSTNGHKAGSKPASK
ncbi:MAG: hypothetical protein V3W34_07460 [Phycisphaerae bacterium]